MKILIPIFTFISFLSVCQSKGKGKLFLNEFSASINHSLYNLNTNTLGYGLGAYHISKQKNFNLHFGLEYNFFKQIQGYSFSGGHSSNENNINNFLISANSFTCPFYIDFLVGKKWKTHFEPGFFVESIFKTKKLDYFSSELSMRTFSTGTNLQTFNLGGTMSIGISYSVKRISLYIKPELKFGLFNNRIFRIRFGLILNN